MSKPKDPPTDALPKFVEAYSRFKRLGTVQKDTATGKLIDEWNKAISELERKPELVDMSPAISAILAVKDEDELVSRLPSFMITRTHFTLRKTLEWQRISRLHC